MLGVSGGDLLDRFRIEMERDIGCIFSESRRVQHELTKVFLSSSLSLSNSGLAKAYHTIERSYIFDVFTSAVFGPARLSGWLPFKISSRRLYIDGFK